MTFAVLLAGVHEGLASYHRRFGLRGLVRRHRALAADASLAVYCYPHRWDSVSFYLQRDDVRVLTAGDRTALAAELAKQPRALVFVKAQRGLAELASVLPAELELVPHGRQGTFVAVGLVRPRLGPARLTAALPWPTFWQDLNLGPQTRTPCHTNPSPNSKERLPP